MKLNLPSPEAIARLARFSEPEPIKPKQTYRKRNKGGGRKYSTPQPPKGKPRQLVNPISGRAYETKSKAFGGELAKYIQCGDWAGYKREYARLWRKKKLETPKCDETR